MKVIHGGNRKNYVVEQHVVIGMPTVPHKFLQVTIKKILRGTKLLVQLSFGLHPHVLNCLRMHTWISWVYKITTVIYSLYDCHWSLIILLPGRIHSWSTGNRVSARRSAISTRKHFPVPLSMLPNSNIHRPSLQRPLQGRKSLSLMGGSSPPWNFGAGAATLFRPL